MFFESVLPDWFSVSVGETTLIDKTNPLGYSKPPGSDNDRGSVNHVAHDHSYCCQLNPKICEANDEPNPNSETQCGNWHRERLERRSKDAKRLGVPLMMSEFGACMDTDECAREVRQLANEADKHLVGWAYWQFKTYHDITTSAMDKSEGFYNIDGTLQVKKVKELTRTYF